MYPNPVSSVVYLKFGSAMPRTVIIKNTIGKEVYRSTIDNGYSLIDISDFRDGTYLVIVDDGTQKIKLCLFKDSDSHCIY
jgi:hypothetical protein